MFQYVSALRPPAVHGASSSAIAISETVLPISNHIHNLASPIVGERQNEASDRDHGARMDSASEASERKAGERLASERKASRTAMTPTRSQLMEWRQVYETEPHFSQRFSDADDQPFAANRCGSCQSMADPLPRNFSIKRTLCIIGSTSFFILSPCCLEQWHVGETSTPLKLLL